MTDFSTHDWWLAQLLHSYTTPYCPRPTSRPCFGRPYWIKSFSEVLSSSNRAIFGVYSFRTRCCLSSVDFNRSECRWSSCLRRVSKFSCDIRIRSFNWVQTLFASLQRRQQYRSTVSNSRRRTSHHWGYWVYPMRLSVWIPDRSVDSCSSWRSERARI